MKLSAILLSGGIGSRMGRSTPKQYLFLKGKPVALHSFELLASHPQINEIIVVCSEEFAHLFPGAQIASPGLQRQDSLQNGLSLASGSGILVHDAARPCLEREDLDRVIQAGIATGAAALATPVKTTIKRADPNKQVLETLSREGLYSIQTPQVIHRKILEEGFAVASELGQSVTDDVSLAELAGHPVQLIPGSESNLKLTTPNDLLLAEGLLHA